MSTFAPRAWPASSSSSSPPDAKAPQACASCKKMKRKCDKSRPACGLCARMDRPCDYADPPPPPQQQHPAPTADDFAALQLKLLELESRLNHHHHQPGPAPAPAPAPFSDADAATAVGPGIDPDHPGSASVTSDGRGDSSMQDVSPATGAPAYAPPAEALWEPAPAAHYPPDMFLDMSVFKYFNLSLPRPPVDIPAEVLVLLGDGAAVQRTVEAYFAGPHAWLPIVSRKRMRMGVALAQGGPDLAMLFLAMRLVTARPPPAAPDVAAPARAPLLLPVHYGAAKRFLSLLEGAGLASLMLLQAMVLVAYYEYAHAVYPAAWATVASCVRYADLLGLPGFRESNIVLKTPSTWTEMEERLRTWWAILVLDRVICLGNKKRYLSPEPDDSVNFPVNDEAWDEGPISRAARHTIASQPTSPPSPFSSLCRAALLAGDVLTHVRKASAASSLAEAASLAAALSSTAAGLPRDGVVVVEPAFLAPRCVLLSAAVLLHDTYSCPGNPGNPAGRAPSPEEAAHQVRSLEALVDVSREAAALAEELLLALLLRDPNDDDDGGGGGADVSPLILDALYGAAATLAWLVREEGPARHADGFAAIKRCLERLGARWRLAAEYARMLDHQDLAYMMREEGHPALHLA